MLHNLAIRNLPSKASPRPATRFSRDEWPNLAHLLPLHSVRQRQCLLENLPVYLVLSDHFRKFISVEGELLKEGPYRADLLVIGGFKEIAENRFYPLPWPISCGVPLLYMVRLSPCPKAYERRLRWIPLFDHACFIRR